MLCSQTTYRLVEVQLPVHTVLEAVLAGGSPMSQNLQAQWSRSDSALSHPAALCSSQAGAWEGKLNLSHFKDA